MMIAAHLLLFHLAWPVFSSLSCSKSFSLQKSNTPISWQARNKTSSALCSIKLCTPFAWEEADELQSSGLTGDTTLWATPSLEGCFLWSLDSATCGVFGYLIATSLPANATKENELTNREQQNFKSYAQNYVESFHWTNRKEKTSF